MVCHWVVTEEDADDGCRAMVFQAAAPGCPEEQSRFKAEVEKALTVLSIVYPDCRNRDYQRAFDGLLGLARVGLVGDNAAPAVATQALETWKEHIVLREGLRLKKRYIELLGVWAGVFAAFAVVGYYLFLTRVAPATGLSAGYANFFVLFVGCMGGAWCSFVIKKPALRFSDLAVLERDQISPPQRLIFTGLMTVMLGLIFSSGLIDLDIGTYKASQILESGRIALLVGAFAGLAEKVLPDTLMKRAMTVVQDKSDQKPA